jgi:hypothetical protein
MEMLMFSGLEAQGEMNRLLDEIYGGPDQASLDQAARCSRTAETDRRQEDSALCTSPQRSARGRPAVEAPRFDLKTQERSGTREADVSTKHLRDIDLIINFLVIVFVVSLLIWLGLS